MLLKYKLRNFCSIKDEVVFSMKPGRVINRFENNVVCINNRLKVLKTSVVVGENAGGKTCFMRSLDYFKYLFKNEIEPRMLKSLSYNYSTEASQFFELTVLADNNIYTYCLEIDIYSVVSESLFVRYANQSEDQNKPVFWVKRTDKNIEREQNAIQIKTEFHIYDDYITKEQKAVIDSKYDKENNSVGLVLKYLSLIGVNIVVPLVEWINNKLILELPIDHSLNVYMEMKKNEEDFKIINEKTFFEIFTLVDSSIVGIEVNNEEPFKKTLIVRKTNEGNDFKIELRSESSGTREFFAWSIQIWKVLYKDCVLFADEIDRVLNVILSEKIVSLIQGSEHKGQFIFSTHNVLHLNTNIYMKEQLNFITKDKSKLSSDMYSLADFKDYRYEKADVYDLYLKGILGGVPNE